MSRPLDIRWLGRAPYVSTWELQQRLAAARLAGEVPDTLLLLEHPHVYTLGRTSLEEHLLVSREFLAERGATVERIDRGGEITYHGPGQLVAYPIIRLEGDERRLDRFVWGLEEALLATLAHYDIGGERHPTQRGVWAGGGKIASIGMHVRRWIVTHGLALNVAPQMEYFSYINPCGHPETAMTAISDLVVPAPPVEVVGRIFAAHFCRLFQRDGGAVLPAGGGGGTHV
ncbi:MAG: lipoyl(octanoyl) transferase LipB [Chloroflexota bacterium]